MNDAERVRHAREACTAAEYRLRTEGVQVALNTLIEISADRTASKNARAAASRTLAEMANLGGGAGSGLDKPLSEMTRAELTEARERAVAYLAELDRPMIEGAAVEVTEPADGEEAEDDVPLAGGLFD